MLDTLEYKNICFNLKTCKKNMAVANDPTHSLDLSLLVQLNK